MNDLINFAFVAGDQVTEVYNDVVKEYGVSTVIVSALITTYAIKKIFTKKEIPELKTCYFKKKCSVSGINTNEITKVKCDCWKKAQYVSNVNIRADSRAMDIVPGFSQHLGNWNGTYHCRKCQAIHNAKMSELAKGWGIK